MNAHEREIYENGRGQGYSGASADANPYDAYDPQEWWMHEAWQRGREDGYDEWMDDDDD